MPPATGYHCDGCGITLGYPGLCASCLAKEKRLPPPVDPPKKKGK